MREILFRAKRKNWHELPKEDWWVEGLPSYGLTGKITEIEKWKDFANCEVFEIDPETLCQYTGMRDKDGNRIWENDIIEVKKRSFAIILWDEVKATFVIRKKGWMYDHFFSEGIDPEDVKVFGNCLDNPELLERR